MNSDRSLIMKKSQLTLTAALIGALCGSQANASAITEPADTIVYFAGSTAASAAVLNSVKSVCDTATFETWVDKSTNGSNLKTYFCKSKGVTGLNDGTKIQVRFSLATNVVGDNKYTTAVGGSMLGVGPVAYKLKLNFLAVSPSIAALCSGDPLASAGAACDEAAVGVVAPYVPQFGLSDLYPSAFVLQNAPASIGGIGSDAISTLKISPSTIVIFNTPVTKSLRNALQDAQFAAGKLDAACTSLSNRELGVCTPSLTGDDLAKIFGGQVSNWGDIQAGIASNKPIKIIRREIGSGTQATLNLVAMSSQYAKPENAYPCVGGAQPEVHELDSVKIVTTSGAMVTALNAAETAGDFSIGFLDTTRNGAGSNTAPSGEFRYIKINGVAPTLSNVANGTYKLIGQATVNRLAAWGGTAQELAVVDAITRSLNDPAIVAKGNTSSSLKQNFGQSGFMVVGNTSCTDDTNCAANPVTAYRFASNPADAPVGFCNAPKAVW
jgi:ABC-type phosphate transport system substrate-binding protein